MFGKHGQSKQLALKAAFERDTLKFFPITMQDLGNLREIKIWHDNNGKSPGWYLQSVEIVEMKTKESWKFPCERWLAKDANKDETTMTLSLGSLNVVILNLLAKPCCPKFIGPLLSHFAILFFPALP